MTSDESGNLEAARRYLAAIERGATGDELAAYFTADVVQEEFPNRLMPNGARRDLAALLEGAAKGQAVIANQRFEIRRELASGDSVSLEVIWGGTLRVPIGSLKAGDVMRARFGVFLDYRDGKIAAQRNYDCFDAF